MTHVRGQETATLLDIQAEILMSVLQEFRRGMLPGVQYNACMYCGSTLLNATMAERLIRLWQEWYAAVS